MVLWVWLVNPAIHTLSVGLCLRLTQPTHYEHIDQAQAEKFTRAIGSHNSRPVQPLNARVIIE